MNPMKDLLLYGTIGALMCSTAGFGQTPEQPQTQPPPSENSKKDWSDNLGREWNEIQERMENFFNRAWRQGSEMFQGENANGGFASSLNLTEQKDHYTLRVNLPDRDIQKVDVRVEADNTLHIIANEEQRTNQPDLRTTPENEGVSAYSLSRYEQKISLPGPVDSAKMTVDRKGNTLTVTLPKAGESANQPEDGG